MGNVVRVRVESDYINLHASPSDRQRQVDSLIKAWKKASSDYEIQATYKKYEHFEKPSETNRKRRKQTYLERRNGSKRK